jgi:hypothetical protein
MLGGIKPTLMELSCLGLVLEVGERLSATIMAGSSRLLAIFSVQFLNQKGASSLHADVQFSLPGKQGYRS